MSGRDEAVDCRTRWCVWSDEAFPLTPLEAWYVMRGYAVKPRAACDADTLLKMPGSLEMVDGYIMLRQR